ncbi:DUF1707 domain-containing protein [Saccharopolyspora cebuensis]
MVDVTHGGSGEIRIGDNERQSTIQLLGEHYAQGRLDLEEYEQRVSTASYARTTAELAGLFTDLPAPHPPFLAPTPGFAPPPPPPTGFGPAPPPGYDFGLSDKTKVAAGLLQIFLPFGIGRFYTGHTNVAVIQLLLFWLGILPCGLGTLAAVIWCLIDGIVLLSTESTDSDGRRLR